MGLLFNLHSFGSSSLRVTNTHTINERSRSSPPTEHIEMTRYGGKRRIKDSPGPCINQTSERKLFLIFKIILVHFFFKYM